METLFAGYLSRVQRTSLQFIRDFFYEIDWERNRLIGIKGARGVSKTTLVLQYLKRRQGKTGELLYVSLDDFY